MKNHDDINKLRETRIIYRIKYKNSVEKNVKLNTKIQFLKNQLLNAVFSENNFGNFDSNDSNRDNNPLRHRPSSYYRSITLLKNKFTIFVIKTASFNIRKFNNKYLNIKDFYDNDAN